MEADSTAEHSPGPDEQLTDERLLLRRYETTRDPVVREELVGRFMPLARRLASRRARRRQRVAELGEEGRAVGRLEAVAGDQLAH